jgi:hypothetical protein
MNLYGKVVRQKNIVMAVAGSGIKNDCAGEASSNLPKTETNDVMMG